MSIIWCNNTHSTCSGPTVLTRQFIRYPAARFTHKASALCVSLRSVYNTCSSFFGPTFGTNKLSSWQLLQKSAVLQTDISSLQPEGPHTDTNLTHFKLLHNKFVMNSNINPLSESRFSKQLLQVQNLKTKFCLLFLVSSRHGSLHIELKRMKVKSSPHMPWRL